MVNQVQVVSILMIVQGSLASIMGLLYGAIGVGMVTMVNVAGGPGGPTKTDRMIFTVVFSIYILGGLAVLASGVLNIIAGVRCLSFRGWVFAIVALASNAIPVLTVYCAPTSLGILIYGLVVILQPDVREAFKLAAGGMSAENIRDRFSNHRRYTPEFEEVLADGDRPGQKDSVAPDEPDRGLDFPEDEERSRGIQKR